MRRLGRIIADDRGAVQIIEASLVFPIVFLVVGFLIYLGSYTLQRVSMHNHAQKIAVITSREIAFPGYDELGAEKSSNADFNWVKGKKPNKAQIEKIMDKRDPYRYLKSAKPRSGELEKALADMVNSVSYISKSNVECNVRAQKKIMNTYIIVEIKKKVNAPVFLELLGITDVLDIDVSATAIVTDTSEFIRNVDTAYDLTNEIFERFGINDKIESCMEKVTSVMKKIGRDKMRFFYNCKGSISIFLVLIMLPMFTCAGMIVDGARMSSAKTALSGAGDLAMNAALSEYDDVLKDVYGLFAMSKTSQELEENVALYFYNTLENKGILQSSDSYTRNFLNSIGSMFPGGNVEFDNVIDMQVDSFNLIDIEDSTIANPIVMKRQIIEYMKFRGPVSIGGGLFTKLKLFKGLDKQTKAVEAKLEVDSRMDTLQASCEAAFKAINKYNDMKNNEKFSKFKGNLNSSIESASKNYHDIAESMIKVNSSSLEVMQITGDDKLAEKIEEKIGDIEKDKKKPSDEYNMQVLDVIVSEMTKLLGDANDENPSTPCLSSIKEMRNDDLKDYQYILKSNKYVDSYYNSVTTCMGKFNKNLTKLTDEENIEEYKPYGEYYNKKYEEITKIIEKANGFEQQWKDTVNPKARESAMELSEWHKEIKECISLLEEAIKKLKDVKSKVNELQDSKDSWNNAIENMDDSDIKTNMKGDFNSVVKDIDPKEVDILEERLENNKTILELALARIEGNTYYGEKICNDKYEKTDYVKQLQSKIPDIPIEYNIKTNTLAKENINENYVKNNASNLTNEDGEDVGNLRVIADSDKFYKFLKKVCPVGEKPDSTGQKALKDKLTEESKNNRPSNLRATITLMMIRFPPISWMRLMP